MNHLTLLLLVDALAPEYLRHMPFVRELGTRSRTGRLREQFGFLPRGSYFGGLSASELGFTNVFACDPRASPFGAARGLPGSPIARELEDALELRRWIEDHARTRVTPYAAAYLSSFHIPIDLLPWFDVVEKYPPWDHRVGYRSIFHQLDERRLPYYYCAWPETNGLADHSDRAITEVALNAIRPPCRFAVVHLQELDGIGHTYGPQSSEIIAALGATDLLIERLIGRLNVRYDRFDLVLFGDHGMVPVTRTIDVLDALETTGLERGRDVVFFLDSTMARFWFPTGAARTIVAEALGDLPGRVLDAADLARLEIAGCDRRNAEMIFLADPGVLIAPNFFQPDGRWTRGMHGYDSDCPDNDGFFLVHERGDTRAAALGVVRQERVYAETTQLLGLTPAMGIAVAVTNQPPRLDGTYTQHPDPRAHDMVRAHMACCVDEIRRLLPSAEVILLTGGFGRDEGGVVADEISAALKPVNDYDLLVIAPGGVGSGASALRSLADDLAGRFGSDFVDICIWEAMGAWTPLSLATYDIRYGSRVLWGDPDVLERLPRYAAADLTLTDGLRLICNRLGGLLTGLRGPIERARSPSDERYLANQSAKALIALGDWHLLRARAYDVSYQTRRARFHWLARSLSVPSDRRAAVDRAYHFKLRPDLGGVREMSTLSLSATSWLAEAARDAIGRIARIAIGTPAEAAHAHDLLSALDADAMAIDNAAATRALAADAVVNVQTAPEGSVRHAVYSSLPLVAAAAAGDEDAFREAAIRLEKCLTPPWPIELTAANWELTRQRLSRAWLALIH